MNKLAMITILSLFIGCRHSIDTDYIRKHDWKYGSGDGWIGDWISFRNNFYKANLDTLFKIDTAKALIISLDKNDFGGDIEIKIKIIKTGKIGTYHQK